MRRRLLLSLSVLWTALLSLLAQEAPAAKFEVLAQKGAQEVRFQLKAPSGTKIKVDWGDGKTEELDGSDFLTAKHTYSAALTETTTVTFDATHITSFSNAYGDKGVGGFGEINAPKLKELKHASFGNATLKESKNGKIDLSKCPELETLNLRNAPGIVFGNNLKLASIQISSDIDAAMPAYAGIKTGVIDLSACKALHTIRITNQDITTLNITGLSALKSLTYMYNKGLYIVGLQDLTRGTTLTKVEIQGNRIGLNELPLKNPAVTYSVFKINQLDYEVPKERIKGLKVDLSHIASLKDWDGKAHATKFQWTKSYEAVPSTTYTEKDGVFVFNDKLFDEGDEEAMLTVEIETPVFSRIELTGYNYSPYRSSEIVLKKSDGEAPGSEAKIEVIVKKGAKKVAFKLDVPEDKTVMVKWGDGKTEELKGKQGMDVKHEYTTALTENTVVTLDAAHITGFEENLWDPSIVGLGTVNAPMLSKLQFNSYYATLNQSSNGVIDLTHCGKLETILLKNAPGITLGKHPELTSITITSNFNPEGENYGQVKLNMLDLSPYPNLQLINIYSQQITQADFSGLMKLKRFTFTGNATQSAKGLRELTKNTALNWIQVSYNELGVDELPIKNTNVNYNYFEYNQYDYRIPANKIEGGKIDLSHLASVNDFDDKPSLTTFVWKKGSKEIDKSTFSQKGGVYTFNKRLCAENEEEASIYVEIANPLFPNDLLSTKSNTPYRSKAITLKKADLPEYTAPVGRITLTTTRALGDSLEFIIKSNGPVKLEGISGDFVDGNIVKYELKKSTIVISGDLTFLSCHSNSITTLKAEEVPNLKELRCQNNQLTTLDLTGLSGLTLLKSQENALTELNLDGCTSLVQLECGNNKLAKLTLTPCTNLRVLHCQKNMLTALNLDNLKSLKSLLCHSNQLASLSISKAPAVNYIECYNNKLKGEEMTALVKGLANLKEASEWGWFFVVDNAFPNDENVCLKTDVAIALGKKWRVLDNNGGKVPIQYPGKNPMAKVTFSIGDKIKKEDFSATVDGKPYASGTELELGKAIVFRLKDAKNADGSSKYSHITWTVDGKVAAEGFEYRHEVKGDASVSLAATVPTDGIFDQGITISLVNRGTLLLVKGLTVGERIQIFNLAGQLLLDTTEHRIETAHLPRGVYVVHTPNLSMKIVI